MKKNSKNTMIYIKFALIMIVAVAVGFIVGTVGMKAILSGEVLIDKAVAYQMVYMPTSIISIVMVVGTIIATSVIIARLSKRMAEVEKLEDEEYDEEILKVQEAWSTPMIIANVAMILEFLLFTIVAAGFTTMIKNDIEFKAIYLPALLVFFIIYLVYYMYVNNKCIRMIQKISPNIKGNAFDFNMQKEMLASFDEGQLLEAALQSMKSTTVGNKVTIILLVISILGAMLFDTGLMAVVCLSIVAISMYIAGNVK